MWQSWQSWQVSRVTSTFFPTEQHPKVIKNGQVCCQNNQTCERSLFRHLPCLLPLQPKFFRFCHGCGKEEVGHGWPFLVKVTNEGTLDCIPSTWLYTRGIAWPADGYQALMFKATTTSWSAVEERALLDYVMDKGFVASWPNMKRTDFWESLTLCLSVLLVFLWRSNLTSSVSMNGQRWVTWTITSWNIDSRFHYLALAQRSCKYLAAFC